MLTFKTRIFKNRGRTIIVEDDQPAGEITVDNYAGHATFHDQPYAFTFVPVTDGLAGRAAKRAAHAIKPGAAVTLTGATPEPKLAEARYSPDHQWVVTGPDGRAWAIKSFGFKQHLEVLDGETSVGRLSPKGISATADLPAEVHPLSQLLLLFIARCTFKARNDASSSNLSAIG
jgi:hypothetical protein